MLVNVPLTNVKYCKCAPEESACKVADMGINSRSAADYFINLYTRDRYDADTADNVKNPEDF